MTKTIKATEIQRGMVLDIHGGTERIAVNEAKANGYGAVLVTDLDGYTTRGLGANETVTLVGHFKPED
jgi:hypothetical protein